ncbi:PilZ domain-containing protein [Bacterioplanoides sp.]|uniref:PilZ domain-containing protein n=1 Tax=Bacterioplanoides sp. TaxID=2066072 RepID=UPI003B5BB1F9
MSNLARNFQEKRDYIRMQVDTPATLTLSDGQSYQVTCIDLSSSGVQLKSQEPIPVNSAGELKVESGGGSTLPLHARVSTCRVQSLDSGDYRIGLSIDSFL